MQRGSINVLSNHNHGKLCIICLQVDCWFSWHKLWRDTPCHSISPKSCLQAHFVLLSSPQTDHTLHQQKLHSIHCHEYVNVLWQLLQSALSNYSHLWSSCQEMHFYRAKTKAGTLQNWIYQCFVVLRTININTFLWLNLV